MSLEGIDISAWQEITPSLVGRSFVIARACYGAGTDDRYEMHAANVRSAGLALGAYAFGVNPSEYPDWPIADQAAALLGIGRDADFLVLDFEKESGLARITQAQARQFISIVHVAGRMIGLYASRDIFRLADGSTLDLGQDWNWAACWGCASPGVVPWTFWQYRGSPLDLDKFNGTQAQLDALAGGDMLPVTDPTPKLISTPAGLRIYSLSGTLVETLKNSYDERLSPYGVTVGGVNYRVSVYQSNGVRQVLLVKTSDVQSRLVPKIYTQEELDAAVKSVSNALQAQIALQAATISNLQASLDSTAAELASAKDAERERIATAAAAQEAARIRAL